LRFKTCPTHLLDPQYQENIEKYAYVAARIDGLSQRFGFAAAAAAAVGIFKIQFATSSENYRIRTCRAENRPRINDLLKQYATGCYKKVKHLFEFSVRTPIV
jgi:hypothetical protein